MPDQMIRTESLRKSFGDVHALKGVDLEVEPATVFGLLGPNGAGKTTTVRILTTLLAPAPVTEGSNRHAVSKRRARAGRKSPGSRCGRPPGPKFLRPIGPTNLGAA